MDLADGITQQDLALFLAEADEQLQLLDEDIIRLENEAGNVNLLQEIFRASHTIKGSSAMIGHQRMSQLAHGMENVLDKIRKDALAVSPSVVDALLKGLDVLGVLKQELVTGEESKLDISNVLGELEAVMAVVNTDADPGNIGEKRPFSPGPEAKARLEEAVAKGERPYSVTVAIDKDTTWASVRCFQVIQELSGIAAIIDSNPSLPDIEAEKAGTAIELVIAGQVDEPAVRDALQAVPEIESVVIAPYSSEEKPPSGAAKPAGNEADVPRTGDGGIKQTVRVDVSRLDTLMEQIGELVINRNYIWQIGKTLAEKYQDDELVSGLNESLSQTGKIVNNLQQDIMTIRMLPIELVFNTMPRMVRDLARKIGKKINFTIEGQETEVDRSVIEHLHDPLIHLLRNSVDHGVESPEERKAAGKPEAGSVHLSARHEQDHIVITVSDDGKGIDPETVKEVSVRKGVISPEMASRLTDSELVNLIMASGISTARQVSEISGRGVGLDIVKQNIEFLNGTITVDSTPGRGTRFTLKLPLTLAIIASLMVSLERTIYAIPLVSIVEVIKLETGDIKTVRGKEVTLYRGSILPLLRLSSIFKWDSGTAGRGVHHIVVVKSYEMQVGIIVDELIGQQEIVVKSLDQFIGGSNGISGASILGDGQVALILDINSLVVSTIAETQNFREDGEPVGAPALSSSR